MSREGCKPEAGKGRRLLGPVMLSCRGVENPLESLYTLTPMTPSFLRNLARARPDPGGGAAAAHGAVLGLALVEKVLRLELKRPGQDREQIRLWEEKLAEVRRLSAVLARRRDEDVEAYRGLAAARAAQAGGRQLAAAAAAALWVPRQIMEQARQALEVAAWTAARAKTHLRSDLLVAAELLAAALEGAAHIARANLPLLNDEREREVWGEELSLTCRQGREILADLKGQRPPA